MSDALTKDLTDQINQHLPGLIGEQLKRRLEQADSDAALAKQVSGLKEELAKANLEIARLSKTAEAVVRAAAANENKERELATREAVHAVREACAKEQVAYSLSVLGAVFKERSMFYSLNGSVPFPGQYGPAPGAFDLHGHVSGG